MKFPVLLAAAMGAAALLGHHSFDAEYDRAKPITVKGVVKKLEMINPHSWIHVEGTDENGKHAVWAGELNSSNILIRRGWNKDTVKAGEEVTLVGSRARDGSNLLQVANVLLPDGRKLLSGPDR